MMNEYIIARHIDHCLNLPDGIREVTAVRTAATDLTLPKDWDWNIDLELADGTRRSRVITDRQLHDQADCHCLMVHGLPYSRARGPLAQHALTRAAIALVMD